MKGNWVLLFSYTTKVFDQWYTINPDNFMAIQTLAQHKGFAFGFHFGSVRGPGFKSSTAKYHHDLDLLFVDFEERSNYSTTETPLDARCSGRGCL